MKEGLKMEGGWLREEHYGAYARYLLQFIEQYATAPFLQCIIVTFEQVPGGGCAAACHHSAK